MADLCFDFCVWCHVSLCAFFFQDCVWYICNFFYRVYNPCTKPSNHTFDHLEEKGVDKGNAWRDEKGPWSIRPPLELVQRLYWGNFSVMGLSAYGLSWACKYHLELNWTLYRASPSWPGLLHHLDATVRSTALWPQLVHFLNYCTLWNLTHNLSENHFFFSFLKKQTNPQYPQPVGAGCAFFQAMIKGKPSFWGKPLIVFIIIIWLCVQSWVRRSTLKWCPASCLRAYYGRFSFVLFVYSSRFCFRWIHVDSCACLLQHCV